MTPLSILDLAPVVAGGTAAGALRNTIDLAQRAEGFGYRRYWLAEHHFAPGVAASAPAVLIGAVAAGKSRIRVGSGAVQLGHQTAVAVVEQFGTLHGLYPGRIDLGLGRSGKRRAEAARAATGPGAGPATAAGPAQRQPRPQPAAWVEDGLLIPPPFSFASLLRSPRFAAQAAVLQQPGAQSPRVRRHRRPAAAGTRHVPHRVRGQHPARPLGTHPPGSPGRTPRRLEPDRLPDQHDRAALGQRLPFQD
jgi:hypothetical protein